MSPGFRIAGAEVLPDRQHVGGLVVVDLAVLGWLVVVGAVGGAGGAACRGTVLMLQALSRHTDLRWVLLYIQRWLKAPSNVRTALYNSVILGP